MEGALSRRHMLALGVALATAACDQRARPGAGAFAIWGPPAGPSIVLAHARKLGLLREVAADAVVSVWRSPDELRAGLTSKTIQLSIMPLNTAANFYNRGQDVRLLNIMTRGLLYVVSKDDSIVDIPSLAGKRLAVPYRKDAPEIVLRRLLAYHGLDAGADLTVRTTGSPIEATQLLLTGQVDAAFAPEPAASAAIIASGLIGKPLRRVIDVQRAWIAVAGAGASLPQAGLAVTGAFHESHKAQLTRLGALLAKAASSAIDYPSEAAEAAASLFGLPKPVLEASIPYSNLTAIAARAAKPEVERYFSAIHEMDAEILGGRLPDAGFYL
jgi:NitT/TauT family transport system substrate-binding protein